MKLKEQLVFWVAISAFLLLFVWIFGDVLLPFVVGIIIAYLLNPFMNFLETHKLSRKPAAVLILLFFTVTIVGMALLLIPPLYKELADLADTAPQYIDSLWERMQHYVEIVERNVNEDDLDQNIRDAVKENISGALTAGSGLLEGLMNGGIAIMSFLTFVVMTPLVAFFMLIEWKSITQWVYGLLPRHDYEKTKSILDTIDLKIAGFIRGQLLVAVTLGALYAIALSLAGLRYGFLIGIASGLLSIIPLFGSIVGFLMGVIVAWLQNGELSYVAMIGGIFVVGQVLEGNFISPKLIGDSVGLHPLWILFALMAGATLFGIVGMLLAVPVTAAIGVLLNAAINEYKNSQYYEG